MFFRRYLKSVYSYAYLYVWSQIEYIIVPFCMCHWLLSVVLEFDDTHSTQLHMAILLNNRHLCRMVQNICLERLRKKLRYMYSLSDTNFRLKGKLQSQLIFTINKRDLDTIWAQNFKFYFLLLIFRMVSLGQNLKVKVKSKILSRKSEPY